MNMREEQGVAQVLAVISGKGGTGKTSLCAGIASCLAMDGLRVEKVLVGVAPEDD